MFIKKYIVALLLLIFSNLVSASPISCPVDSTWITSPSLPTEVKKSGADGSSNFCDFYQFSTQAFLYLMSPSGNSGLRNFQNTNDFPLLEFNDDGTPADSCNKPVTGKTIRPHLSKASSVSTGQAGGGATIYAQDGNVIYYDVRFNRALCDLTASAVEMKKTNTINFPSGTMELKFAWKTLSASEIASHTFVTQQQSINGSPVTLGLVGMHLIRATKDHPEFVWTTYEHELNTPDCVPAGTQANTIWTFSDSVCTAELPGSAKTGDACNYNDPLKNQTAATGKPTNICRVHPYGTAQGDLKAAQNISDIRQQNAGILSLLKGAGVTDEMKVLQNYFTVGALWVSDIKQSSGSIGVPNERGSLRLANTTAETDFQHVNLEAEFSSNCFGCHNYIGTGQAINNNITSQSLSHIFLDIKVGKGEAIDVTSSTTIDDNSSAATICNNLCPNTKSYLKWNGNWTNANASAGSVCGCSQ